MKKSFMRKNKHFLLALTVEELRAEISPSLNFAAVFTPQNLSFIHKKIVFEPPFGGLRADVRT